MFVQYDLLDIMQKMMPMCYNITNYFYLLLTKAFQKSYIFLFVKLLQKHYIGYENEEQKVIGLLHCLRIHLTHVEQKLFLNVLKYEQTAFALRNVCQHLPAYFTFLR